MTATERAKRSDALYYETVSVNRRVLCDMVANREADLEDARADNAELRELARTFYHCTTSGECDECPINGGGPVHLMPDTICDTIHDRMRELGVDA